MSRDGLKSSCLARRIIFTWHLAGPVEQELTDPHTVKLLQHQPQQSRLPTTLTIIETNM